jgi:hypothetical protein
MSHTVKLALIGLSMYILSHNVKNKNTMNTVVGLMIVTMILFIMIYILYSAPAESDTEEGFRAFQYEGKPLVMCPTPFTSDYYIGSSTSASGISMMSCNGKYDMSIKEGLEAGQPAVKPNPVTLPHRPDVGVGRNEKPAGNPWDNKLKKRRETLKVPLRRGTHMEPGVRSDME